MSVTNSIDRGRPSEDPAFNSRDPATEEALLRAIMVLNRVISNSGESIEGNVCYWNGTSAADYKDAPPTRDRDHVAKRINLALLAKRHRLMLEIGLNGGHSALICLLSNPNLHLYSVDICQHKYTKLAADHLKKTFGRRFHFWNGDSRVIMPRLAVEYPLLKFDIVHVDGGHGADLAFCDLSNSLRMISSDGEVVFDDVNAPHLGDVLEAFVKMGYFESIINAGFEKTPLHDVLRLGAGFTSHAMS